MNQVIKLIQEFATLAEKMPTGRMSRTVSIPKMWEAVEDLKPESIKKLQTSLKEMQEVLKYTNENSLAGLLSLLEPQDDSGMDEIESPAAKALKSDSSIENIARLQTFNEEGIKRHSILQLKYTVGFRCAGKCAIPTRVD